MRLYVDRKQSESTPESFSSVRSLDILTFNPRSLTLLLSRKIQKSASVAEFLAM